MAEDSSASMTGEVEGRLNTAMMKSEQESPPDNFELLFLIVKVVFCSYNTRNYMTSDV